MAMPHPYFDLARPIVIGHRGCAGEVPENTLASFEAGIASGAAILESDVHLTRDGVAVLIHDDVVDRVTEGTGRVAELALEDLRRLDAGYRFAAHGTHPWRGRGLRIPTLEEALEAFPEARFNLELKEDVPEMAVKTVAEVAAARAAARTLLTAEDDALMARLCWRSCARPSTTSHRRRVPWRSRCPRTSRGARWSRIASSPTPTATASRSTSGP
jgi:glycerophosphoryl diester phosphodiesterase